VPDSAFFNDFTVRADATIVEVPTSPAETLTAAQLVEKYETALQQARRAGTTVRMLLLCNPHVRIGGLWSRSSDCEAAPR